MRISDWSSDVCSSDLDRGPARPRRAALVSEDRLSLYHRLSHALSGLCRGTNARVAVAGLALHPLVPSAGTTHHEIGRSSCRDRVCQYVYISVADVSLKKQYNMN